MERKKGRPKGQSTVESWILANGKAGESFYSDKLDRHLTALASYYSRKIETERVLVITTGQEPKAKPIIKVTLL